MHQALRVLYVDDSAADRALVRDALEKDDTFFDLTEVRSQEQFEEALAHFAFDLVLTDFNILGFDALAVIDAVQKVDWKVPIIVVTGTGSEEMAAETIKRGAADYVIKTTKHIQRLPHTIRAVVERARLTAQRRRTAQLLRESEAKYRSLFETIQEGIWVIDNNANTTLVNPAMAEMLGYEPHEMVGRHLFEFMDDRAVQLAHEYLEARQRGINEQHEFEFLHKDGSVVYALLTTAPIHDAAGEYQGALASVMEITERKHAEDELKRREEQHMEAQRVAHIGHWELDLQTMTPVWSEEIFRIFGLDPDCDEPSFEDHERITHPDDWPKLNDAVMTAVETGTAFELEFRILRPDGTARWMYEIGNARRGSDGVISSLFGTAQDISERKAVEMKLEHSLEFLNAVIEHSPFATWVSDSAGTVIRTNRSLRDTLDLSDEQIVGQYNVLKDENLKKQGVMPAVQAVFERHQTARFSIPWRAVDAGPVDFSGGRDLHIDVSMFPILGEASELTNVVCQWVDVSERTEAENALSEREALLSSIFQAAPVGILLVQDQVIYQVNEVCCEMLGYSAEELVGKRARMVFSSDEEYARVRMEEYDQASAAGAGAVETELCRKDCGLLHVLLSAARFDDGMDIDRVTYTALDITGRKRAEVALRDREGQLRRLAERLQVVREDERVALARELHDQLGEKLTGLKMDLDWIRERASHLDEVTASHATSAARLVENSMEQVHEICTRLRPPMLDILGLEAAIEWYVGDFERRHRIACVLELDEVGMGLDLEVATAAFRILQEALTNVARHANASTLKILLESASDCLELRIEDDGIGIPEKRLKDRGSLGLLGMRERAAAFGGTVRITGKATGGTQVSIRLPNKASAGGKQ